MDVDATVTQNINATTSGQQHSEAKKAELMRSNSCFYCEKQGHRANVCRKKQADRGNFSSRSNNSREPTRVNAAPTMPDISDVTILSPYLNFSFIFHHLFHALGHLSLTRSLTRRSDRHQIT